MRVFFWAAWYPHQYDPMPGLFVKHHAAAVNAYANVAVIHLALAPQQSERIVQHYSVIAKIPTLITYYKPFTFPFFGKILNNIAYLYLSLSAYFIMKKRLGKPELNHIHVMELSTFMPTLLRYFSGIPYIITEHYSGYLPQNWIKINSFLRTLLVKWCVRKANAISTVSSQLMDGMQAYGLKNNHWEIIPNVVDEQLFQLKQQKKTSTTLRIINVSCFDDEPKNLRGTINAFNYLVSQLNVDAVLTLVGDGPDRKLIEQYVHALQLQDKVIFTGLLEETTLVNAYHEADVFFLFSRYETFGVVIIEALACGLPVLATRVGGIPDIIHGYNGILIESENEQMAAAELKKIQEQGYTFDKEIIRNRIIEKYSYETVGQQFFNLYQAALLKK